MAQQRIGFIGVGHMGGAMAQRLLDRGWPVAVCDINPLAVAPLAARGAMVHPTPAALASAADVVIVVVVDGVQTREVVQGVIAAPARPACVMLCPTISPEDVEACASALAVAGIACLEAPSAGGPARARAGRMSLMLAGDPAVCEAQAALLADLADPVFRVGARVGDGARTKLVNNLLAGIHLAGAAEVLALAQRLGLDASRTLDVIERSSGQSWIASDRYRRLLAGDLAPRAHTTLLAKDTRLAVQAARSVGAPLALGPLAAEVFARALEAGLGDEDDASLIRLYAQPSS
jgi:L-threonate 2-dehydrogenase